MATESDALASAKTTLAHAASLISQVEAQCQELTSASAFQRISEASELTGESITYLTLVKPYPPSLSNLAADAFQNLRNTLDQVAWAAAQRSGKTGKKTYFPFGDTAQAAQACLNNGSSDVSANIFNVMISFRPYRGGNDLLWSLNQIANANKHRLTCPALVKSGSLAVMGPGKVFGPARLGSREGWDFAKNRLELYRVGKGGSVNVEVEPQIYVTLAVPSLSEVVTSKMRIEDVLKSLMGIVTDVLSSVETEGKASGLF